MDDGCFVLGVGTYDVGSHELPQGKRCILHSAVGCL